MSIEIEQLERPVLTVTRLMDCEIQTRLAIDASRAARVGLNNHAFNILNAGDSGLQLIPAQYYNKALSQRDGLLDQLPVSEAQDILKENIKQTSTASDIFIAQTFRTVCYGRNSISLIYYELEPPFADEAKKDCIKLAETLDDLNGAYTPWNFTPRILLGAIRSNHPRRQALVEAFEEKRSTYIGLEGASPLLMRRFADLVFN